MNQKMLSRSGVVVYDMFKWGTGVLHILVSQQ